jgi:endonuclease/exonuclease/phosphatase family metal-dependent hydrolase
MLKIMSLNLWRYYEWDDRVDNIVSLINQEAPDCIAFQEVLTNHAFSDFPASDFIANKCGYKYRAFAPTIARHSTRDRDGNHNQLASEGQAFISKFPIISSESYFLTYHPEYPEEKAVLFCTLEIDGKHIETCNVHLANSDIAYPQLDQVLKLIDKRQTQPIILGDFNIYKLAEHKEKSLLLQGYTLSSELADYVSYHEDNDSLDYIVVPNSKFKLNNVKCPETYVSDHLALIATVDLTA